MTTRSMVLPFAVLAMVATGIVSPDAAAAASPIVKAVTALRTEGDDFVPSGITTTFPPDQEVFHAVVTVKDAKPNTTLKAVWSDGSNASMIASEYTIEKGGSGNIDFTLKPEAPLPEGTYKVDIFLNGKLDRTLAFSVATPQKGKGLKVAKTSGLVSKVTMAEDSKGEEKEPVKPTLAFKPAATFHAIVSLKNAPPDTKIKAAWYAVDVGDAAVPNTLIDALELSVEGTRNVDFTLSPGTAWPPGSYRIEILVNGNVDRVVAFTVK